MCNILITSVQGVNTTPYSVEVSGTATDCKEVVINVNCGQEQKKQVPVINGSWTVNFIYGDICPCGTFIDILAVCASDPSCGDSFSLPLPCGCCPSIVVSPKFDICNSNGQRLVQLSTQIFISDGCTPLTVFWNFGNGQLGPTHNYTIPGTYTFTDSALFFPGIYQAELVILNPSGCPKFIYTVNVSPCPPVSCCPNVTVNISNSDCLDNETIDFTFETTVEVNSGCPDAVVEWDFGDNANGAAQSITSGTTITYSETHNYQLSDLPATATLNIIQPTSSGCSPTTIQIEKPDTDNCDCIGTNLGSFCNILAGIITYGLGITVGLGIILACLTNFVPPPTPVINIITTLIIIAGSLVVISLVLYLIFCTKCAPCGWPFLFLWRSLFAAGIILLVFSEQDCNDCQIYCFCTYFRPLGAALALAGILMFILWILTCGPSLCAIILELLISWTSIIVPISALLFGITLFNDCSWIVLTIGNFTLSFYAILAFIFAGLLIAAGSLGCFRNQ
jgi:hypothetical protein